VLNKSAKALSIVGPKFLHAIIPCTRGWRYNTADTIEVARLATQTCIFPLYEVEKGENGRLVWRLSGPSAAIARKPENKKPVEKYLQTQGRFRHLFRPEINEELIEDIQKHIDLRWEMLLEKAE
jgi:pyruvate ferredoxin oxidoreductase beta subunit